MKEAAPNYPYVVLYGDTLKKIQRKYKGFNFFKNEKKKRRGRELSPKIKPRFVRVNFMASSMNQ